MDRCSGGTAGKRDTAHRGRDSIHAEEYVSHAKQPSLLELDRRLWLLKAMPLDAAEVRVRRSKSRSDLGSDGPGVMCSATISNMRQMWRASARSNGRIAAFDAPFRELKVSQQSALTRSYRSRSYETLHRFLRGDTSANYLHNRRL
jgi:hypothetical protein